MISSSIGMSIFPHDASAPAELVQRADAAMYAAEEGGRDNWCRSSAKRTCPPCRRSNWKSSCGRQSHSAARRVLPADRRTARGSAAAPRLWFAGSIHGAVCCRPANLSRSPKSTAIVPIGELVLDAACGQLTAPRRARRRLSIAVNVSAKQFSKPGFVDRIVANSKSHLVHAKASNRNYRKHGHV